MLATSFLRSAESAPDLACLWTQIDGQWQCYSRGEVADAVLRLAAYLTAQGVVAGDRVLLLMENRPEWAVTALACARTGCVLVPAYTTHQPSELAYIVEQTEPKACIVSRDLIATFESISTTQSLTEIVCESPSTLLFPEILTGVLDPETPTPSRDALYALIATSGTNGSPKFVMLSHGNVQANVDSVCEVLAEADLLKPQRFLSFLPLPHAYEHMAGLHLPLSCGSEIYYCDRLDRLATDMQSVKPTLMTAVPRLYELLYARITQGVAKTSPIQQWLFAQTLRLGAMAPAERSLIDNLFNGLCERLVRAKVRKRFGGALQYFVSGGAALNPKIAEFFTGLGVGILQGYGQTEASPVISVNRPGAVRLDTVGPPLKGVEVKLSESGELLVKGTLVMQGYWRQPEATAETIVDGWLHTGDLAAIDPDGHIRIVGRCKDLIINSGGENIAPAPLEQAISFQAEIEQAVVCGDGRPWLAALVYPTEAAREGDTPVDEAIRAAMKRVNASLPVYQQIRKWIVMEAPATLENGLLTPTQKVKRHRLIEQYRDALDALYGG